MYLVFSLISINLLIINQSTAFTFTNSLNSFLRSSQLNRSSENSSLTSNLNSIKSIDNDIVELNNNKKSSWPNIRFMRTFLRSTNGQSIDNQQNYQNHPHLNGVNTKNHFLLGFNSNEQQKQLTKLPQNLNDKLENNQLGLIDWNKILAKLNQATSYKKQNELINETIRSTKQEYYTNNLNRNLNDKKSEEEKESNNSLINYFTTFFSSNDNETINLEKEKQLTKTKQIKPVLTATKQINKSTDQNEPIIVDLFYFNNNLLAKKQIEVLVCDKTMAIVNVRKNRFKTNRTIQNCVLFDLEKRGKEAEEIVKKLKINKLDIDFLTMMDVINQCKQFSEPINRIDIPVEYENVSPLKIKAIQAQPSNTFKVNNLTINSNLNIQTDNKSTINLMTGIVSGTLWCGLGDLAKNYSDLGPRKDLDICCRAHDHCPRRIKALRYGYGLLNFGISTKSHCQCDKDFFNCLKNVNTKLSQTIGHVYFNVLKLQCIEEGPTCIEENTKKECVKTKNLMQFKSPETF